MIDMNSIWFDEQQSEIKRLKARVAELEDALRPLRAMGEKRLRDVAIMLQVAQEYSRASKQFKDDAKLVVRFLRDEAQALLHEGVSE